MNHYFPLNILLLSYVRLSEIKDYSGSPEIKGKTLRMVDNTPSHRKGPGLLPDVISLHELTYEDPSIVILEKVSDTWTVDTALAAMPMDKPKEQSESPLPYFHLLERLKLVKREGWKRFGIYR